MNIKIYGQNTIYPSEIQKMHNITHPQNAHHYFKFILIFNVGAFEF